jgi:hypothetical protein
MPIIGDALYGGAPSSTGLMLHAWRLRIDGVWIEAPPPGDWPLSPQDLGMCRRGL